MKCAHKTCDNEGRYIDEFGAIVCGICPLKYVDDSIKIADVPALLAWCRGALLSQNPLWQRTVLRDIVGRKESRAGILSDEEGRSGELDRES